MTARALHRLGALVLGAFLALHLGNHPLILGGAKTHLAAMEALRTVYRHPLVEIPLLMLLTLQVVIGLRLAWRRGWPRSRWPQLQTASGVVIALFVVQHVPAALFARASGLDTNTYWAAAVVSGPPHVWYFAPYYVLGILAIFAHFGARLRSFQIVGAGAAVATLIVAGFMGSFAPIDLPEPYRTASAQGRP